MARIEISTGLYAKDDFAKQLELELRVASVQRQHLAVLAAVPQHLPGEGVEEIVKVASSCVRDLVRDEDVAGHLDGDILAVALLNCDRANADVLAFRLQSDLRMRSHHLRNTNWETGVACFPEDATEPKELLEAAVSAARNRRKRIASAPVNYAISIPPALGEFGQSH
jgi:hypothetical protein